jgi:PTH1 family peptidyl-tRNA hydrolase
MKEVQGQIMSDSLSTEHAGRTIGAGTPVVVSGLGNPGLKYRDNRHNIGFMVVDVLAERVGILMNRERHDAMYGDCFWGERKLHLLKPQTYMNRSGRSVAGACRYLEIFPENLVVIHDEIEIPYGRIKVKFGGGNAGHNGLKSISANLGSQGFYRIRVGVGRPSIGDVTHHVLARFDDSEMNTLNDVISGAVDSLERLINQGLKAAQNAVNGSSFSDEGEQSPV